MRSDDTHYKRIEKAIEFIQANFTRQPSLHEIAAHINLSPSHFQRLFSAWAGVSPKKFVQYLSLEHAKHLLERDALTLLDASYETGLSGASRLHDLFVTIEGMTPGEFKRGGESLQITYDFAETLFGEVLVASTSRGLCHLAFHDDRAEAVTLLKARFPRASYAQERDAFQRDALHIFQQDWSQLHQIKLHLHGTPFQLKVWQGLLHIARGELVTYRDIAQATGNPNASRAVGSAVGKNPVAFLIPCHRVIRATGHTGDYMWGKARKAAIIGWESSIASYQKQSN